MAGDFPIRIGFQEASNILAAVAAQCLQPEEQTSLTRALGLVLAQDVTAARDLPSFDNCAMDGFAVDSASLAGEGERALHLAGEQFAGASGKLVMVPGQCLRVTTGAVLPAGADAVVIKEHARVEGDRVYIPAGVVSGCNVRRAGEDVHTGELVLRAGQVMTPASLSLLAALGCDRVGVRRRPTVAVFTTGDEIRAPGQVLAPGEIYDSNRVLLQTLLAADGFEPVAWPVLPDDPSRMRAALADAAFSFDVVITCGGVSAGEIDYLPALLAERGNVHFWKVRMKPGMPVLAGRMGEAQLLCLPGNPVSVLATYLTLGRLLLDGMQGRSSPRPRLRARLCAPVARSGERLEFLRGSLSGDSQGNLQVWPNPADGSHRLKAASDSNALIVIPEGAGQWPLGSVMDVLPFGEGTLPC
jgi:molybdopterin molybdotransferase